MLSNEKVLFTGGYLRSQGVSQYNDLSLTVPLKVSTNPGGYNLLNILTWVVNDNVNNVNFCNETLIMAAWDVLPTSADRIKLGEIQVSSLYNNGASGAVSLPGVERYMVNSGYGIFSGVTAILLDSKADLTRDIYFMSN